MGYLTLGSRQVTAAADATGNNDGNYTAVFDPSVLNITIPQVELYRGVAQKVTVGATATVAIDGYPVSAAIFGSVAEWDPGQPPLVKQGSTVYVYFDTADDTEPAPVVTFWFRYDSDQFGGST